MAKRAIRLLILSILTTSWLVVPVVTQAEAAATSKPVKKKVRVVHQRPKAAGPSASPSSPSRYEDDFDRKASGGGY